TVISDIDEIAHMFTGQNKENWNKWTADMFGKHVQQRALKKQYGLEFEDETLTAGEPDSGIPDYKPKERKDITPQQEVIDQPLKPEETEEEKKLKAAKDEMQAKFKKLGITGKKNKAEYIAKHAPNIGDNPSLSEIVGLLQIMD